MKMNFTSGRWNRNGHAHGEEKSENGAVNGNGSAHSVKNHFVKLQNEVIGFVKHFRDAAAKQKIHFNSNGKIHFAGFQNEFAKRVKRFKKSFQEALAQIRPKFQLLASRIELLANRVRVWFDSSFRNKVLLPVMACTVCVLAVTFFVVRHQLARQSDKEARKTLATANAVVRYSQDLRRNDLLLRFHNLPNVPLWNQMFQSGAPRDLHNTLRSLMEMQKVDIVFYASNRGKILDAVNDPAVPPSEFETAASPALKLALNGDEKADTVRVAGKLYDVVAIPAYDSDNNQIGALALGSELGDAAAQEFSKLAQSQIALVADGHIIASTLPGLDVNAQFNGIFKNAMSTSDEPTANIKPIVLNGVHYYCTAARFESLAGDKNLGYVLLSSREQSLMEKSAAQRVLAIVSFFAILFGALAAWFFINKATEPLRELRQGAEAVGHGDFNRRVPVNSRDECGQLASVFNQMTENLQQSHAKLEKTVETLKNTQEQLVQSEKLSAIGEFVAGVAHELNNPLAAVVGFSELLKKQTGTADEKCAHFSDRIVSAALRCKKIVQSLLSFARRDKPKREPVSMNNLVETVLDIIGYSLRTGNIEVVTQLAPDLPMVLADANQIQQVFLNIISNAQQAMEASQPRGRIKIITESRAQNVRVTIEDNGPGIPHENMPRIFDPFFTTKEVGKGTGLGLSLCYGFIKEHGGNITPTSQLGKGATFVIELPAIEKPAATEQSSSPEMKKSSASKHKGKRVLIIDDEEPILSMIREDLASLGYNVEVTTDGEKALRDLEYTNFDIAICDWKMPGLNGRQIYEQLREINPKICERMIFITGDVVNPQIRRFVEMEKRPCLAKPFTLPEFHSAVENILAAA